MAEHASVTVGFWSSPLESVIVACPGDTPVSLTDNSDSWPGFN